MLTSLMFVLRRSCTTLDMDRSVMCRSILLESHNTLASSGPMEKIHEKLTVDIINYEPSIACLLTNSQRDSVSNIIRGSGRRDIRRDIISSDLGC